MKAQEYVDKYQNRLTSSDVTERNTAVKDLIFELLDESKDIAAARHVALGKGYISILKEQNQKWNAISSRIDDILTRNAFVEIVKKDILPQYAHLF